MYAYETGHLEAVRQFLHLDAAVNLVSARGRTAMFEAIAQNHEDIVKLFLTKETLFINAFNRKQLDQTALLLGARLGYLSTALSLATNKDFDSVVKILLKKPGIDVNLLDTGGCSALILAAGIKDATIVKLLLENGLIQIGGSERRW